MMYFLWYTIEKYDSWHLQVFGTSREALDLINRYAMNTDFKFELVCGNRVGVVPENVVTKYRFEPPR